MTKEDRIKSLDKLNEERNPKRIIYVCDKCGFNILGKLSGFEGIEIKYKDYDIDYLRNWYQLKNDERLHCSYATNYICLNCSKPAFSYEKFKKCTKCDSDNCVHFTELLNKKCPKCDGHFVILEKYSNELEYENSFKDKRFEYLLELILNNELDIKKVLDEETRL